MDLEYFIGTKLTGTKDEARKQDLAIDKCRMPTEVSWRSPRDSAVIPFSPDTLERAHEALRDARKYTSYAENNALPDVMRLAFWLVAGDRAQVAHLLADRYKEHYKERANVLTPDFDDKSAEVENRLGQFRYDIGADPGTVSGEWYLDELLIEAVKHAKDIREYNSKLGVKRPALQTTAVLPVRSSQKTTRRYAPVQLPLPIPAQVSQPAPQPVSVPAQSTPQYTASVAAGGN